ncbi:MAG: DUF952 domain-containing protein [Anaerolineales bacterium]|jgi:uncharacterized protein (DUF952 family)
MKADQKDLIAHISARQVWLAAQSEAEYRGDTLETEGFIHCSKPEQVLETANRYYAGRQDLVLVWIDPQRVKAEIRWEAAGGQVFPHIYGALNLDAVVAAYDFPSDPGDQFRTLPEING